MERVKGFPKAEEIRIVDLGKYHYIVTEEDGKYKFVMNWSGESLMDYIYAFNAGETTDMEFGGTGPMTVKPLSVQQKAEYKKLLSIMNHALIYSTAYYENEIFRKLIGE
jgi:hypothetical protein